MYLLALLSYLGSTLKYLQMLTGSSQVSYVNEHIKWTTLGREKQETKTDCVLERNGEKNKINISTSSRPRRIFSYPPMNRRSLQQWTDSPFSLPPSAIVQYAWAGLTKDGKDIFNLGRITMKKKRRKKESGKGKSIRKGILYYFLMTSQYLLLYKLDVFLLQYKREAYKLQTYVYYRQVRDRQTVIYSTNTPSRRVLAVILARRRKDYF